MESIRKLPIIKLEPDSIRHTYVVGGLLKVVDVVYYEQQVMLLVLVESQSVCKPKTLEIDAYFNYDGPFKDGEYLGTAIQPKNFNSCHVFIVGKGAF